MDIPTSAVPFPTHHHSYCTLGCFYTLLPATCHTAHTSSLPCSLILPAFVDFVLDWDLPPACKFYLVLRSHLPNYTVWISFSTYVWDWFQFGSTTGFVYCTRVLFSLLTACCLCLPPRILLTFSAFYTPATSVLVWARALYSPTLLPATHTASSVPTLPRSMAFSCCHYTPFLLPPPLRYTTGSILPTTHLLPSCPTHHPSCTHTFCLLCHAFLLSSFHDNTTHLVYYQGCVSVLPPIPISSFLSSPLLSPL